jgi:glycerol-3-phosphate dehydrogenase
MRESPSWRATALARLSEEIFDVLVVGGGATGAAIARDASLRGLNVALCERGDFAGETSGQSSKLIHGGIRYLEHGHLPLVFEALAERARLMASAPHLCRPVEFIFPTYHGQTPSLAKLTAGVALYDALALWRPPVRSRRLDPAELYRLAPLLRTAGLTGALAYVDCQTDDARLVLETVLDAESAGAAAASYLEVRRPGPRRAALTRVPALDRLSGEPLTIQARAVVNATGPFSDAFRGEAPALRPTLGVHIVLDARRLPTGDRAFVMRSPRDGRVMFALPAGTRTIIGTTDTDFLPAGQARLPAPGDDIRAAASDIEYLLEAAGHCFPAAGLEPADVLSTYAGLRPLLASGESRPSDSSREHAIWVDRKGVLTVAGGKLTTMRRMAEEAVDELVELLRGRGLDRALGPCVTRKRPLPGAERSPGQAAAALGRMELGEDVRARLVSAYGARAATVLALADAHERLGRRLVPELPYLKAEVVFAVRHDHACEVDDVLRRRVPLFRDDHDQGLAVAPAVADLLAEELEWSPTRRQRSLEWYRAAVAASRRWRDEAPVAPAWQAPVNDPRPRARP